MFFTKSKEKELKMVWEVKKNDKKSYLIGTAHFFPHSFRNSISRYINNSDIVLFEGPLDKDNMAKVIKAGYEKKNARHLFDELDSQTITNITQAFNPSCRDKNSFFIFNFGKLGKENPVYAVIEGMKPWLAFFTIWTNFLQRNGWKYSVDLEAYNIAMELGKNILSLETIEEQIKVLESLSYEKILDFLKRIGNWDAYAKEYVKCYLAGDLIKLKSNAIGFPSRHSSVIDRRDKILYERMLAYLEKGDTVAFVGAPHIRGISEMLRSEGYQTRAEHS